MYSHLWMLTHKVNICASSHMKLFAGGVVNFMSSINFEISFGVIIFHLILYLPLNKTYKCQIVWSVICMYRCMQTCQPQLNKILLFSQKNPIFKIKILFLINKYFLTAKMCFILFFKFFLRGGGGGVLICICSYVHEEIC